MQVEQYSDKAFAVFGNYFPWTKDLAALGGRANANLRGRPGYIFGNAKLQAVSDFVAQANAGAIEPGALAGEAPAKATGLATIARPGVASPRTLWLTGPGTKPVAMAVAKPGIQPVTALPATPTVLNFPNQFTAADGVNYQILIFTLPLPKNGQRVHLRVGDAAIPYHVSEVEKNDSIMISRDDVEGEVSRAVIMNGKWQINGFNEPHDFEFFAD